MKYLVSYATEKYQPCMERLEKSAYKFGIDKAYMYKPEFVYNSEFYEKNKIILDDPVGAGYWLWKPYVIQQTLNKINTND